MTGASLLHEIRGSEEKIVRLLHSGFSHSPFAATINNELTPEFLRWKYATPAGNALSAFVERNGLPVAIVSAAPVSVSDRLAGYRRAWQIGDITTAPDHRGQGLFRNCLATLCDTLPAGDLIFCYPNKSSLHELLRQNFLPVVELVYLARPAWWWRGGAARQVDSFAFSADLRGDDACDIHVVRDSGYLNWRYSQCPTRRYGLLIDGAPDDPEGVLVFRKFSARLPVAVIMELHGRGPAIRTLLARLDGEARRQGLLALMTIGTRDLGHVVRRLGMLPVPSALQPKRMLLVAKVVGASPARSREDVLRSWHVQVGDWDGL